MTVGIRDADGFFDFVWGQHDVGWMNNACELLAVIDVF